MLPIVSVLTPVWNGEKYISSTIASVQEQTLTDWEMILVDDCSTDRTCEIIEAIAADDPRIRLLRQESNQGAGPARNRALEAARGRYIAYLDADDLWYPEKLEKQIAFMQEKNAAFSCCSYEVIDDSGNSLNKYVHQLPKVDYKGFLTNNLLQTVGMMADLSQIDRALFHMPDLRRRQDAATWLQVLKAGYPCYGMEEVLAKYRRAKGSLSGNKLKAAKGIWYLYRKVEHLSLPFSCYCFVKYAFLAVKKRIYSKHLSQM